MNVCNSLALDICGIYMNINYINIRIFTSQSCNDHTRYNGHLLCPKYCTKVEAVDS